MARDNFLLIVGIFLVTACIFPALAEATEWHPWLKKDALNVNISSGSLSDFQALLNIDYDTGMYANFSDVVFTTNCSGDAQELGFFQENYTASSSSWFWVRVPEINSTICMRWDNDAVTETRSNGTKTFYFYDDFEDGDYSSNPVWSISSGQSQNAIITNDLPSYIGTENRKSMCLKSSSSSDTTGLESVFDEVEGNVTMEYDIWNNLTFQSYYITKHFSTKIKDTNCSGLGSQDGWYGSANVSVQTDTFHSGSQALQIYDYDNSAFYAYKPISNLTADGINVTTWIRIDTNYMRSYIATRQETTPVTFIQFGRYSGGSNEIIYQKNDTTLQSYSKNTWYKITVTHYFSTNTHDIWIDDVKKASGWEFYSNGSGIDNLYYATSDSPMIYNIFIDDIEVKSGDTIIENITFELPTYTTGDIGSKTGRYSLHGIVLKGESLKTNYWKYNETTMSEKGVANDNQSEWHHWSYRLNDTFAFAHNEIKSEEYRGTLADLMQFNELELTMTSETPDDYVCWDNMILRSYSSLEPVYTPAGYPNTMIYSPQNMSYNTTSIWLSYSVSDSASDVNTTWYEHNGTNKTLTGNTTITPQEGLNKLTVWCNDSMGYISSSTVYFTSDTIPPSITIHSPVSTTYTTTTIRINYSVSDNLGLDTVWYQYNNVNTILTGNTSFTAPDHQSSTLTLWVNDTAGNTNSASVTFTVDTPPPPPPQMVGAAVAAIKLPCEEDWACSEWSDCIGGEQARTCTDQNGCGRIMNRPSETQACEVAGVPITICTGGLRECAGEAVRECIEGTVWEEVETCDWGCENGACKPEPEERRREGEATGRLVGLVTESPATFLGTTISQLYDSIHNHPFIIFLSSLWDALFVF